VRVVICKRFIKEMMRNDLEEYGHNKKDKISNQDHKRVTAVTL
jgi:hypothetical protein